MAQASAQRSDDLVRRIDFQDLEGNGIIRSIVFPNAMRDVRRQKGYPLLGDFNAKTDIEINYTRLAKIERGEVFPRPEELTAIAEALNVQVGRLLIDPNKPGFDREKWAREHIDANLDRRNSGIEPMLVGAALRVKREEMGRATTDLKEFGLAAATVSRIENADRPLARWDAAVMNGVAKVLGTKRANIEAFARKMFDDGDLDQMLSKLFSPAAIQERNNKKLKALLAQLPGTKAEKLLSDLAAPHETRVYACTHTRDGVFDMELTDELVPVPPKGSEASYAIVMAAPVVGPGIPKGTRVVFDPAALTLKAGDVVAIRKKNIRKGDTVQVMIISKVDGKLIGVSMKSPRSVSITDLGPEYEVAKMIKDA